jgi:hypothetical protein
MLEEFTKNYVALLNFMQIGLYAKTCVLNIYD